MNYHPLSELFPLMQGREFDELVADIKTNGQREPIWLVPQSAPQPGEHKCYAYDETKCDLEISDGVWRCRYCDHNPALLEYVILDGRNRWRACESLGIEPFVERYDGDNPLAFVVSLNLRRRHLSETQRALVAAKIADLPHGVRADQSGKLAGVTQPAAAEMLNVSERSVRSARRVVDDGSLELVNAVETDRISVSVAADIAELSKAEQTEIVAKGEKEILQAAKQIRAKKADTRREERIAIVAAMAAPSPSVPTQRYPVIYADPPWRYEFSTEDRAIENQYPTMPVEDICAMNVAAMATDDAILFLWATSPKLPEAMSVITAWGFTYRTSAVWVKPQLGMGYYFRQQHELLLVATRGNMPAPAPADRPRSVVTSDRAAHSEKPAEFAEAIERMYPTLPKIELFCRTGTRAGWETWGNQNAA